MPDNTNPKRRTATRRKFLTVSGASTLAIATTGVGKVGAVSNSTDLSRVQVALGSVNSPVSQKTQEELRQKAIEAYRQDGGEEVKQAKAVQEADDAPLVGFAVGFDNQGVPRYLTAKTADPNVVEAQQEQLKERASSLRQEIQSASITQQVVTQDNDPYWDKYMSIFAGSGADNSAGTIDHDIDVFHLDNDGVNDGEHIAIVEVMTRKPGVYTNLNGTTTQDWTKATNSPGTEADALNDYAPQNDVTGDGTKTKEYSARGVENSFSWEQNGDVTTENETDSQDADELLAEFYQTQAGDASSTNQELGCVSVVEVSQPDEGTLDIAKVTAEGAFYVSSGGVYDDEVITDEQTINIPFSIL